ncbi:MAG TPA: hypothetical protein PLR06_03150 [Cyclobacteriaceae bacterium]|nr:hypothetical protein [Cyclobacteriaceae bacterium]
MKPKGTGTEYYPLKLGIFWTYKVIETHITQVGGQTNSQYEMKIQVADSFPSEGQIFYRLLRYTRQNATEAWSSLDTWSSRKDQFQAILQEGNIPYIKLAFPLVEGKTWNANALNTLGGKDKCADGSVGCENYAVNNLAKSFQDTGISYEDSVTIIENNEDDPIVGKDVRKSVYARSIGLIYREITTLEYCTIGNCIGKQIVETGVIMKQTLIDHGG